MTTNTTSFSALDRQLADIKIWKDDLRSLEDGVLKNQLLHNVAPFLEGILKTTGGELAEQATMLADQAEALEIAIDEHGDFLQPEMANDLTATFVLGMTIVGIIESEGITLENELMNKQLKDAMKLYKNNTTILLEQIEEITNEDEDDNDDDNDDTRGSTSDVHGQSENAGGDDTGGEGSPNGDGSGRGAADADAAPDAAADDTGADA